MLSPCQTPSRMNIDLLPDVALVSRESNSISKAISGSLIPCAFNASKIQARDAGQNAFLISTLAFQNGKLNSLHLRILISIMTTSSRRMLNHILIQSFIYQLLSNTSNLIYFHIYKYSFCKSKICNSHNHVGLKLIWAHVTYTRI